MLMILAVAVALVKPVWLAVMVAVPAVTPVTVAVPLLALGAMVRVAGTVATPVLLELRLNVIPPAGA